MLDDWNYNPTTKSVKSMYEEGRLATVGSYDIAEFDRWHSAELARAWDEGAEACAAAPMLQEFGPNPYRKATGNE